MKTVGTACIMMLPLLASGCGQSSHQQRQADADHNAFMVDGGQNDKDTGTSFKLGAGAPDRKPKPKER